LLVVLWKRHNTAVLFLILSNVKLIWLLGIKKLRLGLKEKKPEPRKDLLITCTIIPGLKNYFPLRNSTVDQMKHQSVMVFLLDKKRS